MPHVASYQILRTLPGTAVYVVLRLCFLTPPHPTSRRSTAPLRIHSIRAQVLKIGSLKKSMTFFENVLGLKVLRHEEFDEGCEATCNGPYGGEHGG